MQRSNQRHTDLSQDADDKKLRRRQISELVAASTVAFATEFRSARSNQLCRGIYIWRRYEQRRNKTQFDNLFRSSTNRSTVGVRSPGSDSTPSSVARACSRSIANPSLANAAWPASLDSRKTSAGVSIDSPSASVTRNRALTATTAGGDFSDRSHFTNPQATPSPRAGIAVGWPSRISIRQSPVRTTAGLASSAGLSDLGSTTLSTTSMPIRSTSVAASPEFASAITNGSGDCDSSTRVSTNATRAAAGSPPQPVSSRINAPAKRSLVIAAEYPIANKEER